MPTELFANNAATTVATAATAVTAGTTETWTVASATGFPVASSTASPATQFAVVDPAAQTEVIRVINVAGTTWTVIRGVEGTTPVSHAAGYTIAHVVTANAMQRFGASPSIALRRWSAALADAANNPADVMCIGDSITEGSSSTTVAGRWVDQMTAQLRALIPVPGVNGGLNYNPVRYVTSTLPAAATVTGTPTSSAYGLGARSYDLTTTTPVITFTVTGSSFKIFYVRSAGTGVGSYSIDGAGAVSFTTSTGNLGRTDTQASTTVAFATRGTHTVAVKWVSGGTVTLEGLAVFDGDETKGVRVWESGYFGLSTVDITNNIGFGLFGFDDRITAIQPALVILQFGTNDANTAVANISAATYKANMLTIISHIKSACTITPSIVLMAMYRPNVTFVEPWGNYVQALYDIAAADNAVCVLDLTARFPPVSGDVLGLYADAIHPSAKGQVSIGAITSNFLTSDERASSGKYLRTPAIGLIPTTNASPTQGELWWDPTTTPPTLQSHDGLASVPVARRLVSRLTTAPTSTVVTYAGTGLTLNVTAATAYHFRASGQYRTAATTTGIGLRVGGTCTATGVRYMVKVWGVASASTPVVVVASALATANLTTAVLAATTDYLWEIEGVIRVNAAGTLTVDFASEVAASTVTIQPDSFLRAEIA